MVEEVVGDGCARETEAKIEEHKKRREEERKAVELTHEKTEKLRQLLPELGYFEKPSHSDVADALTLRLAKKGIYLSEREAKKARPRSIKRPQRLP